eukprot:3357221-Pyramimonas_sp.AAC.2
MAGWIAEGAGCILAGGAEHIGGWVRDCESSVSGGALLSVCSECDMTWTCRGQEVQRVRKPGQIVLGKGL